MFPSHDQQGVIGDGLIDRAREKSLATEAESAVASNRLAADAMVESAKYGAEATKAQGQAAGQASMVGGLASGISSLAGAIPSVGGSSTPAFGTMPGTPVSDSYMDKLINFYGA